MSTVAPIDMEAMRVTHGLAQARAESARVNRLNCGTVSYRQGHRALFWVGVEYVLTHAPATRDAVPDPELRETERFAPKAYAQGQTDGYWDGVDFALSLGGAPWLTA